MRASSGWYGLLLVVLAAVVALGPATGSAGAVKFTFIGDSKAAGIEFSKKAKRLLRRGHDVRRDLKVCRRLVAPSCAYQGVVPLGSRGGRRRHRPGDRPRDRRRLQRLLLDVPPPPQSGHARRPRPRGGRGRLGEPQGRSPRLPKDQPDHQAGKGALPAPLSRQLEQASAGTPGVVRQLGRGTDPPDLGGRCRPGQARPQIRSARRRGTPRRRGDRGSDRVSASTETEESTTTTEEAATTQQAAETETAAAELTGNSPPVGSNLGATTEAPSG